MADNTLYELLGVQRGVSENDLKKVLLLLLLLLHFDDATSLV